MRSSSLHLRSVVYRLNSGLTGTGSSIRFPINGHALTVPCAEVARQRWVKVGGQGRGERCRIKVPKEPLELRDVRHVAAGEAEGVLQRRRLGRAPFRNHWEREMVTEGNGHSQGEHGRQA